MSAGRRVTLVVVATVGVACATPADESATQLGGEPSMQPPVHLAVAGNKSVEVLGLRRWTLAMVQDSLAKYAPTDSLHHHACAATLRHKLGFADAAAMTFVSTFEDGDKTTTTETVIVSVREPQDSAGVRYRFMPDDSSTSIPDWRSTNEIIRKDGRAILSIAELHLSGTRRMLEGADARQRAAVERAVAFIRARTAETDRRQALTAIREAPNMIDRSIAALILSNFPDHDESWRSLVAALREDAPNVLSPAGIADDVLTQLIERAPRPIDWTPEAETIHAILDGTALFKLPTLIAVLLKTGVGPRDAVPFLRGGGEMLSTHNASSHSQIAAPAHQLLVKLRGEDLGRESNAWRAWIAGL